MVNGTHVELGLGSYPWWFRQSNTPFPLLVISLSPLYTTAAYRFDLSCFLMLMLVHVPLPRLFLRMNHELTARLGVSRPGVEEDRELLESVARTSLRTKLREEIADNVSDSGIGGYDEI